MLRCVLRVDIGSPKMPAMERNNMSQLKESSGTVGVYENWEMAEVRVEEG